MAANTVPTEAPPLPPMAYSTTNASDASTTEIPAAMPAATVTEVLVAGIARRSSRKTA